MSDFIAPKESGIQDYIGAFAVSTGFGCDAVCEQFEKEFDDNYDSEKNTEMEGEVLLDNGKPNH